MTFTLDPAQRDLKLRIYESYRSQYSLLRDFPRDVERFRKAPRYDVTRKPHEGPLFYENFELGMDGERFLRLAGQLLGAL